MLPMLPLPTETRRPAGKYLRRGVCLAFILLLQGVSCLSRSPNTPLSPEYENPPFPGPQGAKMENERNALIEWLALHATREQNRPLPQDFEKYGIPASVTIAQAILETGWLRTNTPSSRKMIYAAKNLFGIKGVGPAGHVEIPTYEHIDGRTVLVKAKFRAYHSYAESFEDHTKLLTNSRYYADALKYRGDPQRYIREVAKNYATDPNYADKIWSIVTRYNLTRFDRPRKISERTVPVRSASRPVPIERRGLPPKTVVLADSA